MLNHYKDKIAKENGIDLDNINILDKDFESLCYDRGKSDDITVVASWITHRYLHSHSKL